MQASATNPVTGVLCAAIAKARRITAADVAALGQSLEGKPRVSHHEASSLFGLAVQNFPACPQWRAFFIEAIAAYLVDGASPRGELTEEKADWLIARFEQGLEETLAFELAANVVQRAANCPSSLMRYALSRLNDLSERVRKGDFGANDEAALDAARTALRAAGLAGRLYVPRERPAPALSTIAA